MLNKKDNPIVRCFIITFILMLLYICMYNYTDKHSGCEYCKDISSYEVKKGIEFIQYKPMPSTSFDYENYRICYLTDEGFYLDFQTMGTSLGCSVKINNCPICGYELNSNRKVRI